MSRTRCETRRRLVAGILVAALLLGLGCGKKAMPVSPDRIAPPAVSTFTGDIEADRVILSWSLPKPSGEKGVSLAAVVLYRSKLPLEGGNCKNCPLRFELLAKLAPSAGEGAMMRYVDKLDSGFRYTYKVVLMGENDTVGSDSNPVDFNF